MKNASLIAQWETGQTTYRLIEVGDWSPGYGDRFVLEKKTEDALGGVRWVTEADWRSNEKSVTLGTMLAKGIRELVKKIPEADRG